MKIRLNRLVRTFRVCLAATLVLLSAQVATAQSQNFPVYIFWQEGCPHCARAKAALSEIISDEEDVAIRDVELGVSDANDELFSKTIKLLKIERAAVPLVVIGRNYEIGFAASGLTTSRYQSMIDLCRDVPCADHVGNLIRGQEVSETGQVAPVTAHAPGTVALPIFGDVDLAALSLPVLTVVLAGVDGFNPCAMWVLALLIALLLGVRETARMWALGAVFLVATGAMYFAVMAAWLNVVLWIGAVSWLRLVISALAIAAGLYYLREFWVNPEGLCRVTPSGRRKRITDAFRAMVEQPNLLVAGLGVAALAIVVNLVELACSAGLPAIYTQTLAMHELPMGTYYGYLLLYISVFLLDDTVIFVTAMLTLRAAFATGHFSRVSHLIGGIVLLVLGLLMALRPEILT